MAAAIGCGIATLIASFPRGLIVPVGIALALAAACYGAVHRGIRRTAGLGLAAVLAVAAIALVVSREPVLVGLTAVLLWLGLVAARAAFRIHVTLPAAPRPERPALIFNPKSGGGKAERMHLADEARLRGIEPIELTPGADLETLVDGAIAAGADALAAAGGDGTQAIVAAAAATHGLPYACVPAGTRNHFALDLGVDRDDVVGALDAFVDGGERRVDLADVNGRVFVNNVSLGLYADAVQRAGYRDAKLRTLLDTVPDELGTDGTVPLLRWRVPHGGEQRGAAAVLVSNNRYRLGHAIGSGTRPRIDDGLLGVAVIGGSDGGHRRPIQAWSAAAFDVEAPGGVAAGIDGEAARLDPPLRFRIHPGALRVRVARAHPGASPSAVMPESPWAVPRALAAIAVHGWSRTA